MLKEFFPALGSRKFYVDNDILFQTRGIWNRTFMSFRESTPYLIRIMGGNISGVTQSKQFLAGLH